MICFNPATLKEDFINAIKTLSFLKGEVEGIELSSFLASDNDEELCINQDNEVCLWVGEDYSPTISLTEFIKMAQNKGHLKINALHSYAMSDTEVYFLLDTDEYSTHILLENTFSTIKIPNSIFEKDVIVNGKRYRVSLFNGFNIFNLLVEESGKFNEFSPSYSPYDYFIRITCMDGIDIKIADSLATAYAFEIQTTFDIQLSFSSGRINDDYIDVSDESLFDRATVIFPLITGNGANELLTLYNNAKATYDVDFKILGFTKVIEYISPTISHKNLVESVSLKLITPDVLKPTATYILELGAIYDKYRNVSSKDSELIKLSVLTAVSLDDIWDSIPEFLKGKQCEKPSTDMEQRNWLEKIADSIYSTRNEIAHAKANYEKRGTECPQKQKVLYSVMLEKIAVRCIRWFSIQPEDKRVVPK